MVKTLMKVYGTVAQLVSSHWTENPGMVVRIHPVPHIRQYASGQSRWSPKPFSNVRGFESFLTCQLIINNGEVAEWSIATVLKTVGCKSPRGSNPFLSALFMVI